MQQKYSESEFHSVEDALKDFGKVLFYNNCPHRQKEGSSEVGDGKRISYLTLFLSSFYDTLADNKFVLVMDNEDRENEGDLIIAAQNVTTEQMAFLIKYSR